MADNMKRLRELADKVENEEELTEEEIEEVAELMNPVIEFFNALFDNIKDLLKQQQMNS